MATIGTFTNITLSVGQAIPEITLTGSTLAVNAVINLFLPGITTPVAGKYVGGKYKPDNFGTASAPVVPFNVQTGYRTVTLKAGTDTQTGSIMFLKPEPTETESGYAEFDLPEAPAKCSEAEFKRLKTCLIGRTITINGSGVITNIT